MIYQLLQLNTSITVLRLIVKILVIILDQLHNRNHTIYYNGTKKRKSYVKIILMLTYYHQIIQILIRNILQWNWLQSKIYSLKLGKIPLLVYKPELIRLSSLYWLPIIHQTKWFFTLMTTFKLNLECSPGLEPL